MHHAFGPVLQEMQGKGLPNVSEMNGKSQLELLRGISGAFRPGILTCLMGVSGAGKTTLMDVLSGRKTGQHTLHIRLSGFSIYRPRNSHVCSWTGQFIVLSPARSHFVLLKALGRALCV